VATRALGRSGLAVPAVVLGGMFRDPGGREAELRRMLDAALDAGLDTIDTAPLYGFGEAEGLLGRWLRGRRERVQLLGKVGLRWDDGFGEVLFETTVGGRRVAVRRDARPEAIVRDIDESLRRLGTDRIELVQIHHRDRATPLADSLGALVRLREAGKLRAIGVCNFDGPDLDACVRALGPDGLASAQSGYSLIERGPEREILPRARAAAFGFLGFSPLARGLLGGRLLAGPLGAADGRGGDPLFQPANVRRIHAALADVLDPIARAHGVGRGAVALAWVHGQPGVSAAIGGPQDGAQLADLAAAVTLALGEEERHRLGEAFARLALDRRRGRPLVRRIERRLRRIWSRLRG